MIALDRVRVAVISPHPDDLALSVGGLLSAFHERDPTAASRWAAVTVFSESLYNPYRSQFSSQQEITAMRREEDQHFFSTYGIMRVDLGFEDSSCIGISDEDESTVELTPGPRRNAVVRGLHQVLGDLAPDLLLMPATIGNHIDHRLAVDAARSWSRQRCPVVVYEDLPYASTFSLADIEAQVTAAYGPAQAWCVELSKHWEAKLRGLACYPSQLAPADFACITGHGERLGGHGRYERLWIPSSPSSELAQAFLRSLGRVS